MERQLVIDIDKCTGCRMCEMACSLEKEGQCGREFSRIKIVKQGEGVDVPIVCLQCEDPVCLKVCPVNAITKETAGGVMIDYDLCIGCKVCLALCPLGAESIDPKSKRIVKCDLCKGSPVCVKFCQTKAIDFVRRDRVDFAKKRRVAAKICSRANKTPMTQGKELKI